MHQVVRVYTQPLLYNDPNSLLLYTLDPNIRFWLLYRCKCRHAIHCNSLPLQCLDSLVRAGTHFICATALATKKWKRLGSTLDIMEHPPLILLMYHDSLVGLPFLSTENGGKTKGFSQWPSCADSACTGNEWAVSCNVSRPFEVDQSLQQYQMSKYVKTNCVRWYQMLISDHNQYITCIS